MDVKSDGPIAAIGRRFELTFEEFSRIPDHAGEALPQLHGFLAQNGVKQAGPDTFQYEFHDSPHGPRRIRNGRFTLTIAVPVDAVFTALPPIEVITLPPFKFVELRTNSFGDEWRRIRDMAEQAGFERSLVEREVYYCWKGVGAPDTVVALQVGIK